MFDGAQGTERHHLWRALFRLDDGWLRPGRDGRALIYHQRLARVAHERRVEA